MCDCHPLTAEDKKIWHRVKDQPRTKAQWQFLHNAIESYRRLIIESAKRYPPAPPGAAGSEENKS